MCRVYMQSAHQGVWNCLTWLFTQVFAKGLWLHHNSLLYGGDLKTDHVERTYLCYCLTNATTFQIKLGDFWNFTKVIKSNNLCYSCNTEYHVCVKGGSDHRISVYSPGRAHLLCKFTICKDCHSCIITRKYISVTNQLPFGFNNAAKYILECHDFWIKDTLGQQYEDIFHSPDIWEELLRLLCSNHGRLQLW